ncbi:transporter substrate-binding domain-containing protein [Segetibacter sp. 3557_3]|uniref:histidine kinase n=1 Tax=Segetibacter sp. 3557_3 TaxID=2547429 RepID=UPI001058890A|nr:histidine kinase [Segetibacter sp. 3557_3]TDH28590.1 transporter substrate-binding domain-containing protein [Segetibacter sp. 3557_3]
MKFNCQYRSVALVLCWMLFPALLTAQYRIKEDSWKETKAKKRGVISVLWYDIEPFIYRTRSGEIIGVEYELMEGFKPFLKKHYGVDLEVNWVDAKSFKNIYPFISRSHYKGLFGLSFYSITDERKREVKFSPPYMPDLNIVVSNNSLPVYKSEHDFVGDLKRMKGYTMEHTTMEKDLLRLKQDYYPELPVYNQVDDYEVLKQIATVQNAFGYVPVSIYVIALQRGIKVKRQQVLATRREGFAAIYSKESDWSEPVNSYFNSVECKLLVNRLIKKYLGEEVANIVLNVSNADSSRGKPGDIELLTKEREIVTQRLIDTALEVQREKTYRNIALAIGAMVILFAGGLYLRFREKKRLHDELKERNKLIAEQKQTIEGINEHLKMKILQAKLNPHFIFNSLNSLQYFIGLNDRKSALLYLTRFASFLRNVLNYGDDLLITAAQEAVLLEQYLWLEQCRFPDRFEYSVHFSGNGVTRSALLPPMMVHSLVEDALYLGILNLDSGETGRLCILFEMAGSQLQVTVSDNGLNRTTAIARQQSKGLDNEMNASAILHKRLTLYNNNTERKIEVVHQEELPAETTFVNEVRLLVPQPRDGGNL